MNIQEYISSGIVEAYVLGLASAEERAEFERMVAQYPEVRAAREAFEVALEKQAMEGAIAPAADVKRKIWAAVNPSQAQSQAPIVPLRRASAGWMKYAVAASLLLLAVSAYLYISERNKNVTLASENASMKSSLDSAASRLARMEAGMMPIWNPDVKMAKLEGQAISPQSYATVYWDTTSKDVYLVVNNLPVPASDQQYQLWALLDGQPIDMGMLEISQKPLQMYRMKNAQNAQAFAITLEKKGGSPTPDLTKLYVMGKL